MNFRDMVNDVKRAIDALAHAAGTTLENKNLSDILKSGAAKLGQAAEHPDVHAVPPDAVQGHAFGDDPSRFGGDAVHTDDPPLPFGNDMRPGANAHGLGPDTPSFDDPSKQGSG